MKRVIFALVALCALLSGVGVSVSAAGAEYQGFQVVNVVVNGRSLHADVPAVNFFGRTVLPVRAVAEAAGMDVQWDEASSTVNLTSRRPSQLDELQRSVDRLTAELAVTKQELASAKADLATAQAELKKSTAMPSADPVFKGSGHNQAVTSLFQLDTGAYAVTMTHSGVGHFSVVAYSSSGQYIELLANDSGTPFSGSKALIIKTSGKYLLDISADSDWTVTISRAR